MVHQWRIQIKEGLLNNKTKDGWDLLRHLTTCSARTQVNKRPCCMSSYNIQRLMEFEN